MRITVRLFARARDLAGGPTVVVELPESANVFDLRAALLQLKPEFQPLAASLLVAVGGEYASDSVTISPGADVAVFPPVSGG